MIFISVNTPKISIRFFDRHVAGPSIVGAKLLRLAIGAPSRTFTLIHKFENDCLISSY